MNKQLHVHVQYAVNHMCFIVITLEINLCVPIVAINMAGAAVVKLFNAQYVMNHISFIRTMWEINQHVPLVEKRLAVNYLDGITRHTNYRLKLELICKCRN